MRKLTFIAALAFVLAPAASQATTINFVASLDCAQSGTCGGGGSGTGSATLTLDTDTGEVNYNITFSGLSDVEILAHVHGPAAPGVPAGVVYDLGVGSPKIGSVFLSPAQQADMLAELHYINIHSLSFTGGELRGQILQVPEPGGLALLGLVLGGLAFARRREVA